MWRLFARPVATDDLGPDPRLAWAAAILQGNLDAERVGRSFITLSYKSEDPQLAGRIARAYANAYLSDQLDANFEATKRATIWLQTGSPSCATAPKRRRPMSRSSAPSTG